MKTITNIDFKILSTSDIPRRTQILEECDFLPSIWNSEKNLDLVKYRNLVDQNSNSQILGRSLKPGEIKCLLSHHQMIVEMEKEWLLVLEDDALVNQEFLREFLKSLEENRKSKPIVFLLYLGNHGVFLRRNSSVLRGRNLSAHRCLALPNGTVGYAVNLAASRIIRNTQELNGSADWPTWSSEVNFYGIFPQVISHDEAAESIINRQILVKDLESWPRNRFIIRQMIIGIFQKDVLFAYGGASRFCKLVILAALWRRLTRYLPRLFIAS